jgi:hypothetical protein
VLSYDWQMSSIPVVATPSDPRVVAAAAFYLWLAAIVAKVVFARKWINDKDEKKVSVTMCTAGLTKRTVGNFSMTFQASFMTKRPKGNNFTESGRP